MNKQGVCVNAFILNDKSEILLLKRSVDDDAFADHWELPGGKVEYKELPVEALKREVKEESGLEVEVINLLHASVFYIRDIQYFEITHFCKVIGNNYKVLVSEEHSEYKWVSLDNIDSIDLSEYMKDLIVSSQKSLLEN